MLAAALNLVLLLTTARTAADAAVADPFAGQPRLGREPLLRAVVERNPTLEAARQAWRAAAARRRGQGLLPDPTVGIEISPFALGTSGPRGGGGGAGFAETVELRQALPPASRRRLGASAAAAESAGAAADYRAALVELVAAASLAYDDYFMIYRELALNDEHLRLAEELRRTAIDRYAAGRAPQQDPLQAELEAARLLHRRTELQVARERLALHIQALVHRSASLPLPPPPPQLPVPVYAGPRGVEAEQAAVGAHPELAARRAAEEARGADLELARLAGRPDLELMAGYDSRWAAAGQRFLAGVAVQLPLHGERRSAGRAEAEARLAQAESERAAAEDRVREAARAASAELELAEHVRAIYQDRLLPASRDQLRAARASYEVGQGSFQALIEAEKNLREAELGDEQALVDLYRRQAELDRAVGRLPPGLDFDLEPAAGAAAPNPRKRPPAGATRRPPAPPPPAGAAPPGAAPR